MVPETGQRKDFRDYVVYTPFEGDLYHVQGWKHTGLWRVTKVTSTHCFFEKFVGSWDKKHLNKKLLLTSWRQFHRDGRVNKFTANSPALTDFQAACANWVKLGEVGEFTVPSGAGKSYVAGLMMGSLLVKHGMPPKNDT